MTPTTWPFFVSRAVHLTIRLPHMRLNTACSCHVLAGSEEIPVLIHSSAWNDLSLSSYYVQWAILTWESGKTPEKQILFTGSRICWSTKKKPNKTLTSLEKELIHKLFMLAISQAVLSNLLHPDLFSIQEPPFYFSQYSAGTHLTWPLPVSSQVLSLCK